MPDLAIIPETIGALGDVQYVGGDILTDAGLQTAVYISLFTDAFDADTGAGGYWGDTVDDQPGGSLLWTLARTVISPTLPGRIETMCRDALQWLIDAGAADAVDVTATISGQFSVTIAISITQSGVQSQYSYNWTAQAATGF
jgi:phage gp46-like protein